MGKTNKAKKFAKIKRTLNPKDKRIKENQEKLKKKELALQKKAKNDRRYRNKRTRAKSNTFIFFI